MKIKFALFVLSLILISCSSVERTISIYNPSSFDREGEMVEIEVAQLNVKCTNVLIKDALGNQVAYQWIYNGEKKPQSIIFQTTLKSNETAVYTLTKGKPAAVIAKTWAGFIPERKDDFAWENDLAAYRMYGPALAKENPSNGVDLWLKSTSDTVVTKRYRDELQNGLSYHIDRGTGLDCYKVGHTLGAGGIAPYVNDSLWIGNHFNTYKILDNGPFRSTFSLTYDAVNVNGNTYKQTITVSTTAGNILNKAVVKYEGSEIPMQLAGGIFLHDNKGIAFQDSTKGVIAYAENAVSDAGIPAGRNYVGVIMPVKEPVISRDKIHYLIRGEYNVNEPFTYYFGGGWSKWIFPTDTHWFNAMSKFAQMITEPLIVKVK